MIFQWVCPKWLEFNQELQKMLLNHNWENDPRLYEHKDMYETYIHNL